MKLWMAGFGLLFYLIRRDVTAMQVQYLKEWVLARALTSVLKR